MHCVAEMPVFGSANWPSNLPNPAVTGYVRVVGLREWIHGLDVDFRWCVIEFLLGFRDHTPSESDYRKVLSVRHLADVFAMSPLGDASRFVSIVRVDGYPAPVYPPGPPVSEPPAHHGLTGPRHWRDAGYCYLALFRPGEWPRLCGVLGANPWAVCVAAELLASPGIWSPDKFRWSVQAGGSDGRAYHQGHVVPCSSGIKVNDILPWLVSSVRVGAAKADLQALANAQEPAEAPARASHMFEGPGGTARTSIDLGFYAVLSSDEKKNPPIFFTGMNNLVTIAALGIYESVHLESAEFTVMVPKGSANTVWCAVVNQDADLSSVAAWLSSPVVSAIQGSDQGPVEAKFDLPRGHPFAKEIKARVMGNPAPSFRFVWQGVAGAQAHVVGKVHYTVAGRATLGHFPMTLSTSSALRAVSRSVGIVLPSAAKTCLSKLGEDSDSDDDEDDDDTGPPVANSSRRRS